MQIKLIVVVVVVGMNSGRMVQGLIICEWQDAWALGPGGNGQ